jgi:hypothetical protein
MDDVPKQTHPRVLSFMIQTEGLFMFKLPMVIIYMIIAFNITAFTVVLQLDMLIVNSVLAKVIAWILTAGSWVLAYINRDKFVKIF